MSLLPALPAGFKDLMKDIDSDNPDPESIKQLRRLLNETPDLWRHAGDLVDLARRSMIDQLPAKEGIKSSLSYGSDQLQMDLGIEGASPLEQLLIQQVIISWIRLGYVEFYQTALTMDDNNKPSIKLLDHWEKRLSASQRRFLRACSTLARIRKLGPSIQVNIADQQVNVSGA